MRKHYLDNIRWIVQVLVVLYHVCFMYSSLTMTSVVGPITKTPFIPGEVFEYAVYPWFMTVLFIVAGISSRLYLNKHTNKEFIRSRTVKLLVPSTIGLLVFGYVQGWLNASLTEGALDSMAQAPLIVRYLIMCVSGTGVLWFLQVLWVLSLVLVPVRNIDKDRLWNVCAKTPLVVLILLAVPMFGAGLILNTPVIAVYRFGLYGFAYFLGYFVFSHDEIIDKIKKFLPVFAVLALASGIAFTVTNFGDNYADAPVNRTVFFSFFAYWMSVTVLAFGAKFLDFRNSFTAWMSRKAWGIYIFHYIGISAFGLFVAKAGILPAWCVYILTAAAGFGAGIILYTILSRIPFIRWAVLGISRKKVQKDVQ